MYPTLEALTANTKLIPSCLLEYKLFGHKRLLRAQRLVAENEIIGRYVWHYVIDIHMSMC